MKDKQKTGMEKIFRENISGKLRSRKTSNQLRLHRNVPKMEEHTGAKDAYQSRDFSKRRKGRPKRFRNGKTRTDKIVNKICGKLHKIAQECIQNGRGRNGETHLRTKILARREKEDLNDPGMEEL